MEKLKGLFEHGGIKQSEVEILERIESYVEAGNIASALSFLEGLRSQLNTFVALRIILRELVQHLKATSESEKEELRAVLRELIPYINGLESNRQRALLLGEAAKAFYLLGDDFNGDLALKASINLAKEYPDLLKEILMSLIEEELLSKADFAFRMVRNREVIEPVLVHLVEKFYEEDKMDEAFSILRLISNPFHRATALYYIAMFEENRDREKAIKLAGAALEEAEKIKDPDTRLELVLKLSDYLHSLRGERLSVMDILAHSLPSNGGEQEHGTDKEHEG
ncbi:hypothetical protein [Thermococcus sp.]|uniref:hypothetical protein n=1 Tax=Thermococcus sp. TaxID=35749 RepID=UPI002612D5B5|nr:hypothetical protein [Thermococcus sp.]